MCLSADIASEPFIARGDDANEQKEIHVHCVKEKVAISDRGSPYNANK